MSPRAVLGMAGLLAPCGIALGFVVSPSVGVSLAAYLAASLVYSLVLKRYLLLDVVVLALLYGMRIVAGGFAASIVLSHWLVAFATFVFLALATTKRLQGCAQVGEPICAGRAWRPEDRPVAVALAAACSVAAVVVFALYVQTPAVSARYAHPVVLSTIGLLALYWLGRMVLLANRGALHSDPVAFVLRDRCTWLVAAVAGAAFAVAL